MADQDAVRLAVLRASTFDNIAWQLRSGGSFGPLDAFEVVANKLLVERGLGAAGRVLRGGPEARRIGSERFIDPDQLAVEEAEFELGIGEKNAARLGVSGGAAINFEGGSANLFGEGLADNLSGTVKRDVLIVPAGSFGGGSEDRFGKLVGLAQTGRELDTADGAVSLVFLPAGAGEIAASDTFDRQRMGLTDDHGTASEIVGKFVVRRREFGGGENMIGDDVVKEIEPEERELGENAALVGNRRGHDDVESREAVGGDEEETVAEIINVANLAASGRRESGEMCFTKDTSCGGGGHWSCPLRSVEHSSATANEVNVTTVMEMWKR